METVQMDVLKRALDTASLGLATKETVEQSTSFVFGDGYITTFNGEVFVKTPNPVDLDAVVPAEDIMRILPRFPDESVKLSLDKGKSELIIKGRRKEAGITCEAERRLPVDAVPEPEDWMPLPADTLASLRQASEVCGTDLSQHLTTVVHATPALVEACDNYRLYRASLDTGFPQDILIPAASVSPFVKIKPTEISVTNGWLHGKTEDGTVIAVQCSQGKYHESIESIMEDPDAEDIVFPEELDGMLDRAAVMSEHGFDSRVTVTIAQNNLTIETRKMSGWYKEHKRTDHAGAELTFDIHPYFLKDILAKSHTAKVGERLSVEFDDVLFISVLYKKDDQ